MSIFRVVLDFKVFFTSKGYLLKNSANSDLPLLHGLAPSETMA